jgi:hypothetical protein
MSPTLCLARAVHATAERLCFDQRLHKRYPITLDVQFTLPNKDRRKRVGRATTINISSGGVLLAFSDSLPSDGLIELAIDWPLLLNGVCLLRLVMRGCIVRHNGNGVAIKAWHHEFRTAGVSASRDQPNDGNGCNDAPD